MADGTPISLLSDEMWRPAAILLQMNVWRMKRRIMRGENIDQEVKGNALLWATAILITCVAAGYSFNVGLVSANGGPHGGYAATTDSCASCHRVHTATEPHLNVASESNLCFTCHNSSGTGAAITSPISTHANMDFTGGAEGSFSLDCSQCHSPHGGTTNIYEVRDSVVLIPGLPASLAGPVIFSGTTGLNSFDDGVSNPASRICVTCHSDINNPGYPMSKHTGGAGHLSGLDASGSDCISCHPHSGDEDYTTQDGFMAIGGCSDCHAIPQDDGDNNPPGGRRAITPEFSNASHHVEGAIDETDCLICHDLGSHQGGQVRLNNLETGSVIAYTQASDLEPFCLGCHDSSLVSNPPFSDGLAPAPVDVIAWNNASHSAGYTCFNCHNNGHGSNLTALLSPYDGTVDANHVIEEEGFCYQCHNGTAASSDIQNVFTLTSHHLVNDGEQGTATIECINCHNPHQDNSTTVTANPDDTSLSWSGSQTDFCLVCHDGDPPNGNASPELAIIFPGTAAGTGYNKQSYSNTTHAEGLGAYGCQHCHDQHGSVNQSNLVNNYAVTGFTTYLESEYQLCWTCHPAADIITITNAFGARHGRHVNVNDSPCILCHDAHSPYDQGEPGLISYVIGENQGDISLHSGYDHSTAFVISGTKGYCYISCHDSVSTADHIPNNNYTRRPLSSSIDCTACHP
jgi:predicted CXXCH cytochrome family protein